MELNAVKWRGLVTKAFNRFGADIRFTRRTHRSHHHE
jgi:hypothetical protein